MATVTIKATAKGSDEKRYVVNLTGPAEKIGHRGTGKPVYGLTQLHCWSIKGYTGAISHPGKGRFYLDGIEVEVTLNDPTIDPTP